MIPFSVLDLSPVVRGATPGDALRNTRDLAIHAEALGFHRYWLAEHHNMTGIASAATSVVMGYVAEATKTIRVGSGGIMLPNHAPLVIAEQFGTLASLYPGRIDLGLGRAPGTDQGTARALRRAMGPSDDRFPDDVLELQRYLGPLQPGQTVRAVPGMDTHVPIWLLGSSLFSAQLAAQLGLPFAFASHFAPDLMMQALHVYRTMFRPSDVLQKPYAALGINVVAADTDEDARRLFTSQQQAFWNLRRGAPGQLPPPVHSMEGVWTPMEKAQVDHALSCAIVGSGDSVRDGLAQFIERTQADELIITAQVFDHEARKRSYSIVAEQRERLAGVAA